jgi:hypothetical protein
MGGSFYEVEFPGDSSLGDEIGRGDHVLLPCLADTGAKTFSLASDVIDGVGNID